MESSEIQFSQNIYNQSNICSFSPHCRAGFVAVTDGGCEPVPVAAAGRSVEAGVDTEPVSQGAPVLLSAARPHTHRVWGQLGGGGGGGGEGGHGEAVTETEEPRHPVTLTVSPALVQTGGGAEPVCQLSENISCVSFRRNSGTSTLT